MNTIGYIVQKEFKQIFRNKGMLPIIFVLPLLQLVILSNAATYEVKNIAFGYIDHDQTSGSRALVEKFEASTYFNVLTRLQSDTEASQAMQQGKVDVVLYIPTHFQRDLKKNKHIDIGVSINAIDGAAAGVESGYVNQIVQSYNKNVKINLMDTSDKVLQPVTISSNPSFRYNIT